MDTNKLDQRPKNVIVNYKNDDDINNNYYFSCFLNFKYHHKMILIDRTIPMVAIIWEDD